MAPPVVKVIQRKEKRKMLRDLKKAKRIAFAQRKKIPTLKDLQLKKDQELQKEKEKKKRNLLRSQQRNLKRLQTEEEKNKKVSGNFNEDDDDDDEKTDEESEHEARRLYHLNALKEDDKILKELEKKLKIKKNSKSLPKSFIADGLDYILNFMGDSGCSDAPLDAVSYDDDSASDQSDEDQLEDEESDVEAVESDENGLSEDDDQEEEEEEENVKSPFCDKSPKDETSDVDEEKSTKPILKRKSDSLKDDEKKRNGNKKKVKWDVNSDSAGEAESTPSNEKTLREDIYGRLRDTQGNVVTPVKTGSYVPPALRNIPGDDQTNGHISKQIKGIINRVNEFNMAVMCEQIEQLYNTNSRASLNASFLSVLCSTAIQPTNVLDRLLLELALLISIIHCNVGQEIGAYFVQELVEKLQTYRHQKQGKELNNVMTLLCCMYNFKVFHCSLVFDLMRLFIEKFQEKDVEILSLVFKFSGFELRKDDPTELKDVILSIQQKSSTVDTSTFEEPGRMRYILDTMLAVKNNNVQKGDHQERVELLLRLKKLANRLIRGQNLEENQLRVRLSDLQNVETKGRWWIVGSAWNGNEETKTTPPMSSSNKEKQGKISEELRELARRQRMNTDVRRSIFFALMTSEDFVEAFESLLALKLKPLQEREIIHVIIDCCVQEKDYNPFYAYLLQKFCEMHRRFQMTFQFNMWDKFKDINTLSKVAILNLAQLTTHLITTKALSLALFKVIEFGALNKEMVRFLRHVLMAIFEKSPSHVIDQVFERVSCQANLHKFREGLRLFMIHFLVGRKQSKKLSPKISESIQSSIQRLAVPHSSMLL